MARRPETFGELAWSRHLAAALQGASNAISSGLIPLGGAVWRTRVAIAGPGRAA